jgi:hypothetical protein
MLQPLSTASSPQINKRDYESDKDANAKVRMGSPLHARSKAEGSILCCILRRKRTLSIIKGATVKTAKLVLQSVLKAYTICSATKRRK